MAKIIAIRHAESVANSKGIYQGQTYDTDLTELGKKQAKALKEALNDLQVNKVIASPLKRTLQTAKPLAEKLNKKINTDKRILETDHGKWEGLVKHDIINKFEDVYRTWFVSPSKTVFPEGEKFADTHRRVHDFIFNNQWVGSNILVTHDNIIRLMAVIADNGDLDDIWDYELESASISYFSFDDQELGIEKLNQIEHLGELRANLGLQAL